MDYNKAKELLKLQQEAKKIQNELELTHIESEVDGIVVTITGALTCHEVKFEGENNVIARFARKEAKEADVQKAMKEAINKGMKKAQEISQKKLSGVMASMGVKLPEGMM